MRQIRFTKEGFEKLQKQYADLLLERKEAVDELKRARELGDLSENGLYKAARARLSSLDSRLQRIKLQLTKPIIIDNQQTAIVGIGNTVKVTDGKTEQTYQLVGDIEADPINNKISLLSPIGKAIAGKQVGDEVKITVPSGIVIYRIIKIY